eukprot:CAMPEP_0116873722 /NCGR_PEP_ID=MMETSP0463-20121206/5011_1 /TAXON_ID=181622 /ORGANISM="Strombidinopsis sp, Strain SopsisLIS2011" /LENGTH=76 /DNA_ID=CAMNT_0004516305 /DNA_START=2565 /DNA_END=2795 /DNA_ORIENTATION=+
MPARANLNVPVAPPHYKVSTMDSASNLRNATKASMTPPLHLSEDQTNAQKGKNHSKKKKQKSKKKKDITDGSVNSH